MGPDALPRTWSNPTGASLRKYRERLYAAEREFRPPLLLKLANVGGKAVVVQLSDGTVWVHAPYALDPALKQRVDALGPVQHIVTPNFEHTKFAPDWIKAYPTARAWACPCLREKSKTRYTDTVGLGDVAPDAWHGEFEVAYLDYERNPFNGKSFFHEVIFFHKPSRALIVTDLLWNYPVNLTGGDWWWKKGMDGVYNPFYRNLMIKDRSRFDALMERILGWDWDMIVPCHGDVIETGAKQYFRQFLGLSTPM